MTIKSFNIVECGVQVDFTEYRVFQHGNVRNSDAGRTIVDRQYVDVDAAGIVQRSAAAVVALIVDGDAERIGTVKVQVALVGERGQCGIDVGQVAGKDQCGICSAIAGGEGKVRGGAEREGAVVNGQRYLERIGAGIHVVNGNPADRQAGVFADALVAR